MIKEEFVQMKQTKWKRILAVMLALLLLLGSTAISASAADSSADNATLVMSALGAVSPDSSGSYNLSSTLTRAQFARMLIMASSYKDLVNSTSTSSPFKDVPSNNWAAAYIRLAASKSLLIGYSDGTYRPSQAITLEQAVNAVLKLLGYTNSDFTGAFPYAQINTYKSIGLSLNIAKSVGSALTRADGVNLLYNMLNTDEKSSTTKYAVSLGYTMNDNGEIDYAAVVNANMYGPYTVRSSNWMASLGITASSPLIYKNGTQVTASDVDLYDVLYYSASKSTVWVYDDKVTGIYEKASPSQDTVTAITLSGTDYTLGSSAAYSALSSSGTLKVGSGITLLLGKNGEVADAVSSTIVSSSSVLYVTATGTKTYKDSSGNTYTSNYISGVTPEGKTLEYATTQDWIKVGDLVQLSFDAAGKMSITTASKVLSGTVHADLQTIGANRIADGASIMDVYEGRYTATSLARINGLTLGSNNVLYYETSNGEVTSLVLNNVTGDSLQYGIVLSSVSSGSNMNISGTYTYDIAGVTHTLNTSNSTLNVYVGPALMYGTGDTISVMRNLSSIATKVTAVTAESVTLNGVVYPYAAHVLVYKKTGNDYQLSTIAKAVAAGTSASFYFDKTPATGGRIRIIVI